jgi:hypothetical protein
MRAPPRRPALFALFVAGCATAVENTFTVDIAAEPDAIGVIQLCGRATPLARIGTRLVAAVPITCEGGGELRLTLSNGAEVTCQIGYVAPGAEQRFDFKLARGACVPLEPPSSP